MCPPLERSPREECSLLGRSNLQPNLTAYSRRYFGIETLMILRTALASAYEENFAAEPWAKFIESQSTFIPVLGYISQPAHAALSGRLAAALNGRLFGQVPEEVIAAIGNHDTGWAQLDLAALEDVELSYPLSFTSTPATISVSAWRRSIAGAQSRSSLSTFVSKAIFACLHPMGGHQPDCVWCRSQRCPPYLF
jgi:hypothetical protein